jgi:hypothetical protein
MTNRTWIVDASAPTAAMAFPTATGYNLPGWAAGCGTPTTGDMCGTASDIGSGLSAVAVSIRRASTNTYWNGSTFAAASETWLVATGTTSWSYPFAQVPASPPTAATPCVAGHRRRRQRDHRWGRPDAGRHAPRRSPS